MRLGMTRAQAIFEHPILFGLVGSMGVANMLYIYRDRFCAPVAAGRLLRLHRLHHDLLGADDLGLPAAGADRLGPDAVVRALQVAWSLACLGVLGFMLLRLASQFHLLDFIIQNLMFDPQTADGRLVILEYASAEIVPAPALRHRPQRLGAALVQGARAWTTSGSTTACASACRASLSSLLAIAISAWRISTSRR